MLIFNNLNNHLYLHKDDTDKLRNSSQLMTFNYYNIQLLTFVEVLIEVGLSTLATPTSLLVELRG